MLVVAFNASMHSTHTPVQSKRLAQFMFAEVKTGLVSQSTEVLQWAGNAKPGHLCPERSVLTNQLEKRKSGTNACKARRVRPSITQHALVPLLFRTLCQARV